MIYVLVCKRDGGMLHITDFCHVCVPVMYIPVMCISGQRITQQKHKKNIFLKTKEFMINRKYCKFAKQHKL